MNYNNSQYKTVGSSRMTHVPLSRRRTQHSFDPVGENSNTVRSSGTAVPTGGVRRSVHLNAYGIPKPVSRRRNSVAVSSKISPRQRNSSGSDMEDRIRVCVRKRPLSSREQNRKESDIVHILTRRHLVVNEPKVKVDMTKYIEEHNFAFDEVFDDATSNQELYRRTAMPLVEYIFHGGKATCFAYGQTGSGKTFTMLDPRNGLYVLAASDIFALHSQPQFNHLTVLVSFFEIYQSQLYDLLNNRKKLHAREDAKQQVCITGLREVEIENVHDLMEVFEFGNAERSTGSTGANADSSRSHAILQIMLKDDHDNDRLHGKFSFIDLAGSERGADRGNDNKQTRMEGSEINKSLLALKECIRALDREKKHTPFRQSKLTQVLKDSLVGDSRTCMIATISPNISNSEHTLNTLRYADRVKEIKGDRNSLEAYEEDSACTGYEDEEELYQDSDEVGEETGGTNDTDCDVDQYYDCEPDPHLSSSAGYGGVLVDDLVTSSLLNETPSFQNMHVGTVGRSVANQERHGEFQAYGSVRSPPLPPASSSSLSSNTAAGSGLPRYNLRQRNRSINHTGQSISESILAYDPTNSLSKRMASRRLRPPSSREPPGYDQSTNPTQDQDSSISHTSMSNGPPAVPAKSQWRQPSVNHANQNHHYSTDYSSYGPTGTVRSPPPVASPPRSQHRYESPPDFTSPKNSREPELLLDLGLIDEFVKNHRLQIRETTEYCKQETKLVATYTLGATSAPNSRGSDFHQGGGRGDVHVNEEDMMARMQSAVSYLEKLDEILEQKQNAVVQLRNNIRQLVYGQAP
ncbi:hypothetical protein IWQ61_009465 [Dispira simplex]|nr:hypothetical protein IWQ61_009465 [Dispira simplex]